MLHAVPQEFTGRMTTLTWTDVVFHCTFGPSLPDHSTSAIDDSNIHATLTYHGAAENSRQVDNTAGGGIALGNSFANPPGWESALYCPTDGSYVSAPGNALYSFGYGDFTIDFFYGYTGAGQVGNPNGPTYWIGVWGATLAEQSWRFAVDPYWHFQWIENGKLKELQYLPSVTGLNLWLRPVIERRGNLLHISFQYNNQNIGAGGWNESVAVDQIIHVDTPTTLSPLMLGGVPAMGLQPALASQGFMREVFIARHAEFKGANGTTRNVRGYLFPATYTDPDNHIRWLAVNATIVQPPFVDASITITPPLKVENIPVLRPGRVIDSDVIYMQPMNYPGSPTDIWKGFVTDTPNMRAVVKTGLPRTLATNNYPYVQFEEETITTGFGMSATLDLPATINERDILIAMIQMEDYRHFSENLYFTAPQGAYPNHTNVWTYQGSTGTSSFASGWKQNTGWDYALTRALSTASDWPIQQPSWDWSTIIGASDTNWIGRVLRFSNANTNPTQNFPLSVPWFGQGGTGPNPIINSTTDQISDQGLFVHILRTNDNQVIPEKPNYTTLVNDSDTHGSCRVMAYNSNSVAFLHDFHPEIPSGFTEWASGRWHPTLSGNPEWVSDIFQIRGIGVYIP